MNPITHKQYQKALATCRNYLQQEIENYNTVRVRDVLIKDSQISRRLYNVLFFVIRDIHKKNNTEGDITNSTLKFLADNCSKEQLLKCRNIGRKCVLELEDIFKEHNIVWSKKYDNTSSQNIINSKK